ncbi:MAG: hypothetical protein LBS46_04710 [Dysgonamonadaceae bacterium]|jgi:hypothetical protein|nr:hypothetical protein [Dysgonamonadaceae bacterium]
MKTSKQTVFYVSILLVSLSLVVGSCEKEWPEAGETIPVRFLLQQAPSGEGESLTRSSASGTGEEASSVVPLGDNLYLHASLEVAPPEPTRDALTFNSGAQIIVAAYEGGNTVATASAVYEVNGSAFTPYNSGPELSVTSGQVYRFVAYSYNSSSPLTHSTETVSLSPATATDGNFLWGTTTASVSSGSSTVSITMKRRLSRASVRVTTPSSSYPITAISGITIGPGYSVDMQLSDGSFTSTASTIPQPVSNYTGLTTNTVNTDPRIVCTNGSSSTTVTIGSITVGSGAGITYTDLTAVFNKQLEPNKSYILRVDIRKGIAWAGSNIYWVETESATGAGHLTFSPFGDRSKEMYQGVFFKWGSLVGVSPTQYSPGVSDAFDVNDTIYVPNHHAAKPAISWVRTTPAAAVTDNRWTNPTGHPSYYWQGIPYVDVNYPSSPNTDYTDDYLTRVYDLGTGDESGGHDPVAYKGDICKYLSGQPHTPAGTWRMPTVAELRSASEQWTTTNPTGAYWRRVPYQSTSGWVTVPNVTTNAVQRGHPDGSYNAWTHGASYCGVVVFPASGYRENNFGYVHNIGATASYWSSTIGDLISGRSMQFLTSLFDTESMPHRPHGFPVRCVLQE